MIIYKKKNIMKKFVAVFCLISFFSVQSCFMERSSDERVKHTEEMTFESFDGIKISRLFKTKVIKGDKFNVTASVPERYADCLSIEIDSENNLVVTLNCEINNPKRRDIFEAEITCPSFERIIASDLCKVSVVSEFSAENIELMAYSLSEITFREQLTVGNNCIVNAESMSKINIIGTTSSLEVKASDMANVDCSKLSAKTVNASSSSMSGITVNADEKLELKATDMSRIRYTGGGEVVKSESESMSTIKKR